MAIPGEWLAGELLLLETNQDLFTVNNGGVLYEYGVNVVMSLLMAHYRVNYLFNMYPQISVRLLNLRYAGCVCEEYSIAIKYSPLYCPLYSPLYSPLY